MAKVKQNKTISIHIKLTMKQIKLLEDAYKMHLKLDPDQPSRSEFIRCILMAGIEKE